MKRWLGVVLTGMLAVSITACGTKANTTNEAGLTTTSQAEPTQSEKNHNSVPTFDELIAQAKSSTYKLDSYAMENIYSQNMAMEQGEMKQEEYLRIKTTGEYIAKPIQQHTITEFDVNGQAATSEEYSREDLGTFTVSDGVWTHRKDDSNNLNQFSVIEGSDVATMLEQFSSIGKENIEIAIDGDTYVITAHLTGDKVKEAITAITAGNPLLPSEMDATEIAGMFEVMDEMEVKFKTILNKEQLYFISSETSILSKASDGEMKMSSRFDTVNKVSKHNEIDQILIPQEALDSTK